MEKMDDYLITSIVFFVLAIVFWITLIFFYYSRGKNIRIKNFMSNIWKPKYSFIPKGPYVYLLFLSFLLFFLAIVLVGKGIKNSTTNLEPSIDNNTVTINALKETFGDSNTPNTPITYKSIGYGPILDKLKVKKWLNTVDTASWPDGNGNPINIPGSQFKSLYGFIPPSFSYYPKGQTKNDYNKKNYKSGRENCIKACEFTDCTAVQTEVPENCSQKASPTKEGNSCGSNSEFSCTLFYDNIKNADDAYWKITDGFQKGCFEETDSSCIGKKYYEDNVVPIDLPNKISKPSENIVTFCNSNVKKTNSAGYGIISGNCSCTGPVGEDSCNDPNCCVMRPLLTTEYTQNKYPFYSLPINVSKVSDAVSEGNYSGNYSVVVPAINYKNGVASECGIVNNSLVSCLGKTNCGSNLDKSDCWKIDSTKCTGDTFDKNNTESVLALNNYKSKYKDNNGKNYNDLYPSCYYRQKLTVVEPIQFNCDPSSTTRGCVGSPSILYTDSLSNSGGFSACSDTSVIPSSQRCQNSTDLAGCSGFPFSCGTSNGTNSLWVRN